MDHFTEEENDMDGLEQAKYRIRNREFERAQRGRRRGEFKAALERLEREEFEVSHPDAKDKVAKMEEIRALRSEITSMMDEEFKLSEQYEQIADG
jgi:hypothetical protein